MSAARTPFKKILIANRGEIALRVMRACHELGIGTVAVFSEADRNALFVRHAEEAICLGEPQPLKSYLNQDAILSAAKITGADAIHPGYGFLAENARFAARCREEGITFIGPSPEAIHGMGDKVRSRELMRKAGVPVVPGEDHVTRADLERVAARIGFPVMLKASAGGGGKGIRIVHDPADLVSAFERAQSEANTAFGDPSVYIEKFVECPHHIEVQVLGDANGEVHHLFERECSVQRRHQKVVEETPSPFVTLELRRRMCEVAVKAARAIGYTNAGTIEFLVDKDRNFYFLEMNTRLQVEHPITELVTGVDIVKEQIRVAAGLPLSFNPSEIVQHGHAIECRVCAEDPENNFMPAIGTIAGLALPGGPSVRLDSAIYPGMEVTLYYDPMLAKLCTWGRTRAEAIARMQQALEEFKVANVQTNLMLLMQVMRNEEFNSGVYDTGLISRLSKPALSEDTERLAVVAAAVLTHARRSGGAGPARSGGARTQDAWKLAGRPGNNR